MVLQSRLPFTIDLRSGQPVYEQIVMAVKRAVAVGQLRSGDSFPSVRELSRQLGINPNTAQKAVSALTSEGLLEVRPGVGTVVSRAEPESYAEQRRVFLDRRLEEFVVEARHLGITRTELLAAMKSVWSVKKK